MRQTPSNNKSLFAVALMLMGVAGAAYAAPQVTRFSNQGGIINTRHNLTQSTMSNGLGATMDLYRNNYGQVCVYCHTPHGANSTLDAPLWNRTHKGNTYTTYDNLGTSSITQTITQPGVNSLTCMSCHDGTVAVDSIVNMPGSGRYSSAQQSSQNDAFLDTWTNASGNTPLDHARLDASASGTQTCMACHTPTVVSSMPFEIFQIGTDLTNDHPVGITFPTSSPDFNTMSASNSKMSWFDLNGNGRANANEIRAYDTGDGPEVECASCHDPHGVPTSGVQGTTINPTFLRVSNEGSGVCLTCHIK